VSDLISEKEIATNRKKSQKIAKNRKKIAKNRKNPIISIAIFPQIKKSI